MSGQKDDLVAKQDVLPLHWRESGLVRLETPGTLLPKAPSSGIAAVAALPHALFIIVGYSSGDILLGQETPQRERQGISDQT
jgi:hypothetical protein